MTHRSMWLLLLLFSSRSVSVLGFHNLNTRALVSCRHLIGRTSTSRFTEVKSINVSERNVKDVRNVNDNVDTSEHLHVSNIYIRDAQKSIKRSQIPLSLSQRPVYFLMKTWDVYVSQSPSKSKEKGIIPFSSIIEAFLSFSPSPDVVKVHPAKWKKQSKSKEKGYTVRCIKRKLDNTTNEVNSNAEVFAAFEFINVDSVDKVYHIVTHHMELDVINPKAFECLTCYFQGNERLEDGTPSQAISLYNRALSTARKNKNDDLPQGSILMKRSQAYLKRASNHRKLLRLLVKDLADVIPDATTLQILYQTSLAHPSLAPIVFARLTADSKGHQLKFRSIRYRHDMYEFALLHAARDSLQATELSPTNPNAWALAGECLAKLRKLNESTQYYQKAVELNPDLEDKLREVMERNQVSMEFIEVARGGGFSADTLRLALDVAHYG